MSEIVEKWGRQVAERGFAQVPNYLLLLNSFLDPDRRLAPAEMLVLIQLVGGWWKKEVMPYPSMTTLATRCGVSDRQIQRAVNKLVKANLIGKINRRTESGIKSNNAYDLTPLVGMLTKVARAFPNEFPRKVDHEKVRELSDLLDQQSPEFGLLEDESQGASAL